MTGYRDLNVWIFMTMRDIAMLEIYGVNFAIVDVYKKQLVKVDKMMPATQMVFLELLYMNDEAYALKSKVANKLNLTKTSITRATAQLEELLEEL